MNPLDRCQTVLRLALTADLDDAILRRLRALVDDAFEGGFTDEDWEHALGGTHAIIEADGVLMAHGSLVERTCGAAASGCAPATSRRWPSLPATGVRATRTP